MKEKKNNWVYFLSSFPPRECGIATFTKDLTDAFDEKFSPKIRSKIIAVNDNSVSTYNYPKKAKIQIDEEDKKSYVKAAEEVNNCPYSKIVNIQHEFGLFGGWYGEYLVHFLKHIKKPVVTTFHSVIPGYPKPTKKRFEVVREIAKYSKKIVVISGYGKDILVDLYGLQPEQIAIIPHGIPKIKFKNEKKAKKALGLSGRTIISTFGLLSKRKGIEFAINAMPRIIKETPDALYLVIGETHPLVRREEGEKYRNRLKKLVKKKGLNNYIKFYNKYLSLQEIIKYLEATDIYITPYYDPNQISSGTLAYAIGAGKACISTPYLYAKDVLRNGRGVLVKYRDYRSIAKAVNCILANPELKANIEKNAYEYSRGWVWSGIAESYTELFNQLISELPPNKLSGFQS